MINCSDSELVGIIVCHGGEWIGNQYHRGEHIMETVRRDISYNDLVDLVYELMEIERDRFDIELCTSVEGEGNFIKPKIKRDKDIQFMMMHLRKITIIYATVVDQNRPPTPPYNPNVTIFTQPSQTRPFQTEPYTYPYLYPTQPQPQPHPQPHPRPTPTTPIPTRPPPTQPPPPRPTTTTPIPTQPTPTQQTPTQMRTDYDDDSFDCEGLNFYDDHRYSEESSGQSDYGCGTEGGGDNLEADWQGEHRKGGELSWIIPGASNYQLFESVQESLADGGSGVNKGDIYTSIEHLKRAIRLFGLKTHAEFRIRKANKKRYDVRCKDKLCKFQILARRIAEGSDYWEVRKVTNTHTCTVDGLGMRTGRRTAGAKVIGEVMASRLSMNGSSLKPQDIVNNMRDEYGVSIIYSKAWRSKEEAECLVFGPPEESFQLLPSYLYVLEKANPGTITAIEVDEEQRFKYLFWCYGACISGFRLSVTRPVICIDATSLKGRYRGIMFVAVCKDATEEIFPVAFGMAHVEDFDAWVWFLRKLRSAIGVRDEMVIISDQHPSIKKACSHAYPEVPHCLCGLHLGQNIRNTYKTSEISTIYERCRDTYLEHEWEVDMAQMRELGPRGRRCHDRLMQIGAWRWARSKAIHRRYTLITTNIAESMNSCLKHARQMPITVLVEFVREMNQRWFHERRTKAKELKTPLTTKANEINNTRFNQSCFMQVCPINDDEYQVKHSHVDYLVHIRRRTCTCMVWQTDCIPCSHAVAVISHLRLSQADFVAPYYKSATLVMQYDGCVRPVGHKSTWDVPEDVRSIIVLPPPWQRGRGRRRFNRIPSAGERPRRVRRCKLCGRRGHNRQSCPNPSGASSTPLVQWPPTVNKKKKKKKRKPRKCSKCKQLGHMKNKCPTNIRSTSEMCLDELDIDIDFQFGMDAHDLDAMDAAAGLGNP